MLIQAWALPRCFAVVIFEVLHDLQQFSKGEFASSLSLYTWGMIVTLVLLMF